MSECIVMFFAAFLGSMIGVAVSRIPIFEKTIYWCLDHTLGKILNWWDKR